MVSVIFLNYNRCEDLYRSLSRIIKQTDVAYEVLVIDQNSSDASCTMVKSNFPEVTLFELKENLGVAGGRNFGAKVAKGEYLVFIDDDAEFVYNNSLFLVSLVFDNNPSINVIAFNINGHPEIPEKYRLFSFKSDKFTNFYIGCGHAIKKNIFHELGGYSENLFFWGEEIEFAIKTYSLPHNKILYKGNIIIYHRVTPVQRLKWKDGRFYFKVRNRLILMRTLLPVPISYLYILYYLFVYSIRAIQLNEIKSYQRAIIDFKKSDYKVPITLNVNQWLKYFFSK